MGLLSLIRKIKAREKEMRILVLGLDNAGKTTVLKQLKGEDTDTVSPTLGFSIETLHLDPFKLTLWDVGGQKSLRAFWRNYFEETDGVVWVVDSADAARMQDCKEELQKLLQEERLVGASLLVLANKQDLKSALSPEQVAEALSLQELAKHRHYCLAAADARTGNGLQEAIEWLVEDIASRIF